MIGTISELKRLIQKPPILIGCISVVALSVVAIETVGYLVWRRFPLPLLVIATAFIWVGIGKAINQPQLSKIVEGMSVGLCAFGALILIGAFLDAFLWADTGYLAFGGAVALWGWIAFESYRGAQILKEMPEENKVKVTMSTAEIITQMTETQHRIERVVADSTRILKETQLKFG